MSHHQPSRTERDSPVMAHDTASLRGYGSFLARQPDPRCDVTARLEWLDDLMFAAIDGDPAALEAAADAWNQTVAALGAPAVEESRLQYMRRAQSVWSELRNKPNHPPHKVFAAIEVISLLAGRVC